MAKQTGPETMKAWTFSRRGLPADVLTLSELPVPQEVKPTQVLVKVSHAALNPFGYFLMWAVPGFMRQASNVPEFDFSGHVVRTGAEVRAKLKTGAEVFGMIDPGTNTKAGAGSLAQYIVVEQTGLTTKPRGATLEAAAGFAVVGTTANLLVEKSGLKKGDSVLVNGGSSSVGLIAIQLARRVVGKNGRVVAVCSAPSFDMVKAAGADEAIDYTTEGALHRRLKERFGKERFSAILDTVGSDNVLYNKSPGYLAARKPFVTIALPIGNAPTIGNLISAVGMQLANRFWPRLLGGTPRPWIFVNGDEAGLKGLEAVRALIEEDALSVRVDSVYSMGDVQKAYARIMSRRAKGKVIVEVQKL